MHLQCDTLGSSSNQADWWKQSEQAQLPKRDLNHGWGLWLTVPQSPNLATQTFSSFKGGGGDCYLWIQCSLVVYVWYASSFWQDGRIRRPGMCWYGHILDEVSPLQGRSWGSVWVDRWGKNNSQHTRSESPAGDNLIVIFILSVKQRSICMITTSQVVFKGTYSAWEVLQTHTHTHRKISWLCSTARRVPCTNEAHYAYFHVCPGNPAWNVADCYCISLLQVEWVQAIQLPVCEHPPPPPLSLPLLCLFCTLGENMEPLSALITQLIHHQCQAEEFWCQ